MTLSRAKLPGLRPRRGESPQAAQGGSGVHTRQYGQEHRFSVGYGAGRATGTQNEGAQGQNATATVMRFLLAINPVIASKPPAGTAPNGFHQQHIFIALGLLALALLLSLF